MNKLWEVSFPAVEKNFPAVKKKFPRQEIWTGSPDISQDPEVFLARREPGSVKERTQVRNWAGFVLGTQPEALVDLKPIGKTQANTVYFE